MSVSYVLIYECILNLFKLPCLQVNPDAHDANTNPAFWMAALLGTLAATLLQHPTDMDRPNVLADRLQQRVGAAIDKVGSMRVNDL